jgi:hypothetical protein
MNKVFAICYQLRAPLKNYSLFYEAIKKSPKWWHFLDATWLIYTSETAEQIRNRLIPHIDKGDSLLIIEVRRNCDGWLVKEAWDWINQHANP